MNTNPFKFGVPVEGVNYLNRPELEATVSQFLDNRIHVVLIGPRRFGKTSFVSNLLRQKERQGALGLYSDIFNITSHRDFLQQILRSLSAKNPWKNRIKEWLMSLRTLRPMLSLEDGPGGPSPVLSAEFFDQKDTKDAIQDVLDGLAGLGERVIFVLDEFQQVSQIGDRGWLEATLRTHMQQLKNTAFLFTGSQRRAVHDMINNSSRPFYRSCQPIEFPSLGPEFTQWVIDRFGTVGTSTTTDVIDYLRRAVHDSPNYVQMACFHLVAQGVRLVTRDEVDQILATIVRQNIYVYQTLLMSLTPIQQRALRLAANSKGQAFSSPMLKRYEIKSGPYLASAFKALKEKQLLDESTQRGKVVFDDPLFAIWLKTEFGD